MGVFGTGGKAGTMLAPLLVGGIATVGGWRAALAGAALSGLLVTALLVPLVRRERTTTVPGVTIPTPRSWLARPWAVDLGSAVRRMKIPMTRQVALLCCIALLISVQSRAIQTFTTAYIVEGTEASLATGNLAFFALLLGGGLAQPVAGSLADRFDRASIGGIAAVLTALLVGGTVFLTYVSNVLARPVLVSITFGYLFLIGAMMYTISPVKNALVSANAGAEYSGGLFGVIQTASAVGSATGPVLFGFIATERGLLRAYPVVAIVSLLLGVLFFMLWRHGRAGR